MRGNRDHGAIVARPTSVSGPGTRVPMEDSLMRMFMNQWQGRGLLLSVGMALVAGLLVVGATAALANDGEQRGGDEVHLQLTPSQPALAACMPDAKLDVSVRLTTDKIGFDSFEIQARNLPPNREYTVFLLQTGRGAVRRGRIHRRLQHQPGRQRSEHLQADRPGGVLVDAGQRHAHPR